MAMKSTQVDGELHQEPVTYAATDDETLSEAVIAALRTASGRAASPDQRTAQQDVGVLAPLFETIDPDALDALFTSVQGEGVSAGSVSFTHSGYDVTVTADGDVRVSTSK